MILGRLKLVLGNISQQTGNKLLARFNDEQVKMIEEMIDPILMKLLQPSKEEVKEIKQTCKTQTYERKFSKLQQSDGSYIIDSANATELVALCARVSNLIIK